MDDAKNVAVLAKRFFDGIEKDDISVLHDTYSADVGIWHNTDGVIQTKGENVETLKGVIAKYPQRRFTERRLDAFPGGFVQQHVLVGTLKDGRKVSLPAVIVCKVNDGKITRLDEYFDSVAADAFLKD
jgi:ketosteroid isomerase-like protein